MYVLFGSEACTRELSESAGPIFMVSDSWLLSCPEHSGIARAGQLPMGSCLQFCQASDSTQWQKGLSALATHGLKSVVSDFSCPPGYSGDCFFDSVAMLQPCTSKVACLHENVCVLREEW